MNLSADKYSGIVTIIAVLIAVIYTSGEYDKWDFVLGLIGIVLGIKYFRSITNDDIFLSILVSILLASSLTAILFSSFNFNKKYDFDIFIYSSVVFFFISLIYNFYKDKNK